MDDSCAGYVDTPAEKRQQAALIAFLGAGMPSALSTALIVTALAGARRAVAMHKAHDRALDQWLAGEVRMRGIMENAAVLAVLELPRRREETAQAYRQEHPDRAGALRDLLAVQSLISPVLPRARNGHGRATNYAPTATLTRDPPLRRSCRPTALPI